MGRKLATSTEKWSELQTNNCFQRLFQGAQYSYSTTVGDHNDHWINNENIDWLITLLDAVVFGVVVIDPEKHEIAGVNRAASQMIGLPAKDIVGQECWQFICTAERNRCPFTHLRANIMNDERFLTNCHGEMIPIIKSVVPIIVHGKQYLVESFVDISERKQTEERLRFLSLYDSLTGLYNRASFKAIISQLLHKNITTLGVIVCDIDGLKTINDAFGQDQGDALLKQVAELLKKAFVEGDIIARIGADEFALLLPDCDESKLLQISDRIYHEVALYNTDSSLVLSMSLGYAMNKLENNCDMEQLLKQAEDNMYREKLLHRQSARSAIVSTLLKALDERDFITGGHAERLQTMMEKLARCVGTPEHRMSSLVLLAQFHDIGKIGIPDAILNKPGCLTNNERKIMQQHCQIGYRIAKSSPALYDVADWILMHHEWWNGKGYPLGLSREQIPLECRILSIVDAYDAMTSDRPYRKAMSRQAAQEELKRWAGAQFDPVLTNIFIDLMKEET